MLVVTATDLPRLMACNGSRLMAGFVPVVERDDTARREGDAAHWLVREVHNGNFQAEELIDRKAPNGVYITPEIVEHVSEYLELTVGGEAEIDTSISGEAWRINGRADKIIYEPETFTLRVPDLKYGWSIVEPEKNWTLIAHAIGWAHRYSATHRIDFVSFEIYQPRPHHPVGTVRKWEIAGIELLQYADELHRVLSNPTDQLNTGPQCYKCPALATCPAARKAQMNAIEASEHAFVDNIDNDNLSFQLDNLARAMQVLKQAHEAYSELATHRLREGQIVPNYALEKKMSHYRWPDHFTADILKALTGRDLRKSDLVTPNQAIKMGVPKVFVETIKTRDETSTKLTRIDVSKKAEKMFNQSETKGN